MKILKAYHFINHVLIRKLILVAGLVNALTLNASSARLQGSIGTEKYITVEKDVKLHITDIGSGPAIVLIHGWNLSDDIFRQQYTDLSSKGFRVIGITLRGCGKSDKPEGKYDYDVFAQDVKSVLDQLGVEHLSLGGFSMGGAIAIHYVAKYNSAHVDKLFLMGAAAPSWVKRDGYPYGVDLKMANGLIDLSKKDRKKLTTDLGSIFGATETAFSTDTYKWINNMLLEASPYAGTASLVALREADLRTELSKIKIPTAIFHGVKDKICSFELAQQLEKGIEGAQLIPFENSGHSIFLEETEKFNTVLIDFIKQ